MTKKVIENFRKKYCDSIAEWMIVSWFIVPLLMGIINYIMLTQFYYDAYVYYDCYKIVVAVVLSAMLIISGLFIVASFGMKKWNISYYGNKLVRNEKWLIFWIALPVWSLICVYFSVFKSEAFWGVKYMAEGYMAHLFGLAMMFCASFIRNRVEREKILTLFCIVTDILTFVMLGFEYDVPFVKNFSAATGVSTFANSNHFAYILSMAILCMAGMYFMYYQDDMNVERSKKKKMTIFFLFSFLINVYALMINNTFGVYLAVFFGLIVLMVFWRVRIGKLSLYHYLPFFILLILTAVSFAGFLDNKMGESMGKSIASFVLDLFKIRNKANGYRNAGTRRFGLWLDSLEAIGKRPILGYGPGIRYNLEGKEIIDTLPHNEYIECALFLGIPGLVMYLGGLISLCVDRCKRLKKLDYTDIIAAGALVGYLISAFVGARRFYTSPYMFVFVGMLINWNRNQDSGGKEIATNDNEKCENEIEILEENKEDEVDKSSLCDEKQEVIESADTSIASEKAYNSDNLDSKGKRIFSRIEMYGIDKVCYAVLFAWTVVPVLVALGYIPIGISHWKEGVVILTYHQIMYNFSLICVLGLVGFIMFAVILSGKRDRIQLTTGALIKELCKKEIWVVLLWALLGWTFLSSILSDDVVTSIIGTASKRDGFLGYCMYASVFGLAYFIKDQTKIRKFMAWYAGIANFMGLVMMIYEWQIPVLVYMSHANSSATFMNPNHFGYYLCMSIMCLVGLFFSDLYREKREDEKMLSKQGVFYIISFTWQIYVIMINNTLGAYVAIVLAMIISLIFWKVRVGKLGLGAWIPFVIVVVITLISYLGFISTIWGETVGQSIEQFIRDIFIVAKHSDGFEKAGTNRMGLWIDAIKLIPQHPIFGFGPESLTGHFKDVNTYDRPHNEYLQMAVFCGIPALLMYLSSLITLCVNRCKKLKELSPITIAAAGVVVGYLISAFFGFTIYYTTPYFFMFLGFVAGSANKKID